MLFVKYNKYMNEKLLKNPKSFWEALGKRKNWIDYILPKRKDSDFWDEGIHEAENIKKYIEDNSFVIEYGCGIGRIAKPMKKHCKKIIGLDICKDFVKKAGEDFYTIEDFKEKDIATFIYCISVLQHNDKENRIKIIKNIYELLKKGGSCFINFPIKGEIYSGNTWFVSVFKDEELLDLFKDFSDVKLIKGNLVKYGLKEIKGNNETFVLAKK